MYTTYCLLPGQHHSLIGTSIELYSDHDTHCDIHGPSRPMRYYISHVYKMWHRKNSKYACIHEGLPIQYASHKCTLFRHHLLTYCIYLPRNSFKQLRKVLSILMVLEAALSVKLAYRLLDWSTNRHSQAPIVVIQWCIYVLTWPGGLEFVVYAAVK